jgi:hypothetical protein
MAASTAKPITMAIMVNIASISAPPMHRQWLDVRVAFAHLKDVGVATYRR